MELSWSTFLLEMLNFLVLVWILKRFLYKPVLEVIARRREGIEAQLAEARQAQEEAAGLKAEYEGRLAERAREQQQARDALAEEINAERARLMSGLQDELAQQRKKAQVAEARQRSTQEREIEHQALQQGAQFATQLLSQAAVPELEARLLTLLLDGIAALPDDRINDLRTQWGEAPADIQVCSAFPLSDEQQQQLEQALCGLSGLAVPVRFSQDGALLAGLRVAIGAWVLHANLQDELKGFAEFAHGV